MTQAASCGSTPAALRSTDDLATLTGACGLANAGVTGGSSTSASGGGGTTSSGGIGGTEGSSTTAGSEPRPVSTGASQTTPSFGVRSIEPGLFGGIWNLGMAVAVAIFVGRVI